MINWQLINTLFLDMDGTLLDLKFDNFFWRRYLVDIYAQNQAISLSEAQNLILKKYISCENTLDWYCTDYWSRELGLNVIELKREVADQISVRHQAIEFLQFIQHQSKRVLLVTNAHPDTVKIKLDQTGIDEYMDSVVSSHEIGRPKEDPLFWEQLGELEPFNSEHTCLIDDNTVVLQSAKQHGIKHLYSIKQPDSSRPPNQQQNFPAIDEFAEIISPIV